MEIVVDGISGRYSLTKFPIPSGALGDDKIEETMRIFYCYDKISNLEPFKNNLEGASTIVLPEIAYSRLRKLFPMGDVHVAYHRIPTLFFQ